jgi:dUTP pyrophosphatase
MRPKLGVLRLPHAEGLPLPAYETAGSAGMDLVAAVEEASPLRIGSGERCLVPTGLVIQLPEGHEAQVRPRSGLALKHGVTVLNAPGTVDQDYRGEVKVLLINHGAEPFEIIRGMRIAQMVICRVAMVDLHEMDVLNATVRGAGGFGSTGTGRRKDDRP